jgi:hypothetical protein
MPTSDSISATLVAARVEASLPGLSLGNSAINIGDKTFVRFKHELNRTLRCHKEPNINS